MLKADKVLVGRDCRTSSEEIYEAVVRGINDAGADIYDIGLSSTPMVFIHSAYGSSASCTSARKGSKTREYESSLS